MPVLRNIPMHLIDEPEIPMRTDIDDGYLSDLAADIAAKGLINPIAVKGEGERFRIMAGHCRFLAHKQLGRDTIEAKDYSDENVNAEEFKIAENLHRTDITDAEWATYLSDIQQKYHYDIETLKRMTRRSEDWINKRLSLFDGDKAVFAALQAGQINLAHALVLNRFPDQWRAQYLQQCIESTPPAKVVQQWLVDLKKMGLDNMQPMAEAPVEAVSAVLPGVVTEACTICGGNNMPWTMMFPRIHQHCLEMIQKAMRDQAAQ
jgi:ParB/RepB/Spo0J family partition protein